MQTVINKVLIAEQGVIGPDETPTGFFKVAVDDPINLLELGLEGDFQADRRVHGGLDKAIHHYAAENYDLLKQALPHLAEKFNPGTIGENFSTNNFTEENIHIGDIFTVGSAIIQVSQPRRPCWKLNHRYGNGHLAKFVVDQQITGWYYRVLQAGKLQVGDDLVLSERLPNSISIAKLWEKWITLMNQNRSTLVLNNTPGLALEWLSF